MQSTKHVTDSRNIWEVKKKKTKNKSHLNTSHGMGINVFGE
jgi:hypothetical protein